MTLPTDPSEISTDMIMAGIEALRPKGTQPADDQPVAVVTIYRSSFVLAMHSPEFDSDNPAHRSWFIDRCYQAAQSVAAKTTGDGNNAVLSAEETIVPLASATVRTEPAAAGFAAPVLDEAAAEVVEEEPVRKSGTHFEVYEASDGWRFRLRAGNGEPIASGEAYKNRRDAIHAIALIESVTTETPIETLD